MTDNLDAVLKRPFPMVALYEWMMVNDKRRKARAEEITERAGDVARAFQATSTAMIDYANPEPFHPARLVPHEPEPLTFKHTKDVAFRLGPGGTAGRKTKVSGAATVGLQPGELDVVYLDRELSVTRTTKRYRDPSLHMPGRKVQIDVLLLAADDAIIVGEIKIKRDRDLSYGLVQALAAVSLLATPSQIARLQKHGTPNLREPFDVYLISVPHNGNATYLPALNAQARLMAAAFMAEKAISDAVRRVVHVQADPNPADDNTLLLTAQWVQA